MHLFGGSDAMWIAHGIMWISTAMAAIAGRYFTHSAWCLWVFVFPICVSFSRKNDQDSAD